MRNRQNVQSSGLRKSEMLPPEEISAGIIDVVNNNFGAAEEEIILSISRALGFKATSGSLRKVIADVIKQLIFKGTLLEVDGMIVTNKETITA